MAKISRMDEMCSCGYFRPGTGYTFYKMNQTSNYIIGQKMEYCFPNGVHLNDQEKSDIGYLSLPDTHSTTQPELESRFYFRIQIRSGSV